jgi:hypothetical protein
VLIASSSSSALTKRHSTLVWGKKEISSIKNPPASFSPSDSRHNDCLEEEEDTCLRHVREDRHNDGLEEEEDTCLRHLREDRHNDGVVFQPPDALADVEHEVGEGLA